MFSKISINFLFSEFFTCKIKTQQHIGIIVLIIRQKISTCYIFIYKYYSLKAHSMHKRHILKEKFVYMIFFCESCEQISTKPLTTTSKCQMAKSRNISLKTQKYNHQAICRKEKHGKRQIPTPRVRNNV